MGRWFGLDPTAHLADPPQRQAVRVAAYLASSRMIAKAQGEGG